MNGMTIQERLEDISSICGLSEDIVRRVQSAERESILKSLRKGEKATLPGRCVIRPIIKSKLQVGGTIDKNIKLTIEVASALKSELTDMKAFDSQSTTEKDNGIRLNQISSLA